MVKKETTLLPLNVCLVQVFLLARQVVGAHDPHFLTSVHRTGEHCTVILNFQTDKWRLGKHCRPRSDCSWRARQSLIRPYTVCHSICIIWTHYCLVNPHCSNFFSGVRIFWIFTFTLKHRTRETTLLPLNALLVQVFLLARLVVGAHDPHFLTGAHSAGEHTTKRVETSLVRSGYHLGDVHHQLSFRVAVYYTWLYRQKIFKGWTL